MNLESTEITSKREDYTPWLKGYSENINGQFSPWRYDRPPLFVNWINNERRLRYGDKIPDDDIAIDFGCGNGIKTIELARAGVRIVTGIDLNGAAIAEARRNAKKAFLADRALFYQGKVLDTTRQIQDGSVRTIMDIYRLTHDGSADRPGYDEKRITLEEYRRIIKKDGLLGLEFFAIDPHFYGFTLDRGRPVISNQTGRLLWIDYSYQRDASNPEMAKSPESYNGMFNVHFTRAGVTELLDGLFEVVKIQEPRHTRPDQSHRHTISVLAKPI